jgi:hypothetical protein
LLSGPEEAERAGEDEREMGFVEIGELGREEEAELVVLVSLRVSCEPGWGA